MTDFVTEHVLLPARVRRFTPTYDGTNEAGGHYSTLVDDCTGDWSWKPHRDRALGYDTFVKKCKFVTFLGVPKSAAEMFRGRHA